MKNLCKSSHHQSENTFVFETFSKRVEKIKISAARKDAKYSSTPQDADSFFAQGLDKWRELNLTTHYVEFSHEVEKKVGTLPQLVHHQILVVEALKRHLQIANSLALQPLLDLLVCLSRDLQGDFYQPYFADFFSILVRLLETRHHDVEALEHIFTCLSFLIKFLWRLMKKDMQNVYLLMSPLLNSDSYKPYINSFAAQAYSFLIRKKKNMSGLLDMIFSSVKDNTDLVSGIGRLLFEVIKGSQQQFHSLTAMLVPLLLDKLTESGGSCHILDVLSELWQLMIQYTTKSHFTVVSSALLNKLTALHSGWLSTKQIESGSGEESVAVLRLVGIWVEYQDGVLIDDQASLVKILLELLHDRSLPASTRKESLEVTAILLLCSRAELQAHIRPMLLSTVYEPGQDFMQAVEFTKNVFDIPLFEKDVLPRLIVFCHAYAHGDGSNRIADDSARRVLRVLTSVLMQKAYCGSADECAGAALEVRQYPLDFAAALKKLPSEMTFLDWLVLQLKKGCENASSSVSYPDLWAVVFCMRHVRPLEMASCSKMVKQLLDHLLTQVETQDSKEAEESLWLAHESLVTLIHLSEEETKEERHEFIAMQLLLNLLSKFASNADCLGIVNLSLTFSKKRKQEELFTIDEFKKIFCHIESNLSSCHSKIRLLTLHICCQFDLPLPVLPPSEVVVEQRGLFRICLDAELTPATLYCYRDKLIHLRKLEHRFVANQLPVGAGCQLVALRYLIGQLHVNFELIMPPVTELIKSHAEGMELNDFWKIHGPVLEQAAQLAEQELHETDEDADASLNPDAVEAAEGEDEILVLYSEIRCHGGATGDRTSHATFRHRLWSAMHGFAHVCEPRSRIIAPILLNFVRKEFYPQDLSEAPTQDLRLATDREEDMEEEEVEETGIEQESSEGKDIVKLSESCNDQSVITTPGRPVGARRKAEPSRRLTKASNNTLIVHLKLFSLFNDPRSLYLEPQLCALYLELLKHKAPQLQKVAFDCLLTYKHKYLMPYKDNFYRVLDDKTFRNEIVLFSIDSEQSAIKEEYRSELIPLLMRILYGKMRLRFGKNTGGRLQGQARKSILLSFIACSQTHEMHVFLDLVFHSFIHFISNDVGARVQQVLREANIASTIPLRKMQGVLNTAELILSKLGHRMHDDYLSRLLQIILCVAAQCSALLTHRTVLTALSATQLKRIRTTAQLRLIEIFTMFENYAFSASEIDAMFHALVWPQVVKLPNEGIYTPTPLLKLFRIWSASPRFLCLLAKCHPQEHQTIVLTFVFELLQSRSVSDSVVAVVIEIVENLLTSDEGEEAGQGGAPEAPPIDPGPVRCSEAGDAVPYGTSLLLPYVSIILAHLTHVVERLVTHKSKIKAIPTRELNILSLLSAHVDDVDQSAKIVGLLLPFLGRRLKRSADTEVDILTAAQHLISKIPHPHAFLPTLATLFSCLSARQTRSALCLVLAAASEHDPEHKKAAALITKLNAWDRRHIEEPDYALRLEGFTEAIKMLQRYSLERSSVSADSADGSSEPKLNVNLLLLLVHNCVFLISSTEDLALRSSALECLQRLIEALSIAGDRTEEFKLVVVQHMLPEVKLGLKHRLEVARHGFLLVLSYLVKHFPTCPLFSDLSPMRDEVDVEKDFFLCITHVQLHRRSRALRRMAHHLGIVRVKHDTLVSFLLPLTSAFLRDEAYAKQTELLDAAVEATGAVARHLSWFHYRALLEHQLHALGKEVSGQKLTVRLLVQVLDSFHFDLKNSTFEPKSYARVNAAKKRELTRGTPVNNTTKKPKEGMEEEIMEITDTADPEAERTDLDATAPDQDQEMIDDEAKDIGVDAPGVMVVCPPGLATRIHKAITLCILPQLQKCLVQKAKSDDQHKLAQAGRYAEDDEVLRVPIALTMIKLLQTLPVNSLDLCLSGILGKVCQFLSSRAQDIRDTARSTLTKILRALGPTYFAAILKEMRSVLKRGYQLHVLCFSLWKLLDDIKGTIQPGDLDSSVAPLTEVFNEELFGFVADEKEVQGIVSKLFEARTTKSVVSYGLMACVVSKGTMRALIQPLQTVLETTRSGKQSRRVDEVLQRIAQGLMHNKALDLQFTLTYIHQELISKSMGRITENKSKEELAKTGKRDPRLAPESTFLLKPEPARAGNRKPKAHGTANMYIMIDFGLQMLYKMLKRELLVAKNTTHLELLDGFVIIMKNCLANSSPRVTASALRCLTWLLRFPLPAFKKNMSAIANQMFILLKSYASAKGAGKGDNFELISMCFKAVTVLVRDVPYHKITTDQLRVLLGYAETDLVDYTRQATAFSILKAILSRKLIVEEMVGIIRLVEEQAVTASAPNVQLQCRQVALQYLLNYPLEGSKLRKHLEYFVQQRDYAHESGRSSVLHMLCAIFDSFTPDRLAEHYALFFLPLVERLGNEESVKCKELTALAIKTLLGRLSDEHRDHLVSCCTDWMKSHMSSLRSLAALAAGLFVEVENTSFERHLPCILPLIAAQIHVEKYEQGCVSDKDQRAVDHLLFLYLDLLLKVLTTCPILHKPQSTQLLNTIWGHVQAHLTYEHEWVRLVAARLFGILFAAESPAKLAALAVSSNKNKNKSRRGGEDAAMLGYLQTDVCLKLHGLCGAFCNQLSSPVLSQDLADQIVKNLVFLAKVVKTLPKSFVGGDALAATSAAEDSEGGEIVEVEGVKGSREEAAPSKPISTSLHWLIMRLCREVKSEINGKAKSSIKRSSVFKWLAAVALDLATSGQLEEYLARILRPLVRETTDSSASADPTMKALGEEVLVLIKSTVGSETFNAEYSVALRTLATKRDQRKSQRSLEAVTNPELRARKTLKKNLAKKEAKKRKIGQLRPAKGAKKGRVEHLAKTEAF